jgi:hypothetical protein
MTDFIIIAAYCVTACLVSFGLGVLAGRHRRKELQRRLDRAIEIAIRLADMIPRNPEGREG